MFIHKTNKGHVTNQEPSSPKVTCTGQVKRSNKDQTTVAVGRRRNWLRILKTRWFRRLRRRKFWFFRFNCCKNSEKLQELKQTESSIIDDELESELATTNANLLMRCKSGPYRSSSLGNRFVESRRDDDETDCTANESREDEGGVEAKAVSLSRCKPVSATHQQ
ncbi:uncharacterized protein LOC143579097 [Bidens hawaiensis]|uniref:uncharacterized protein LOC143579097 n=1 Tax=Bidens hawaiensis TaxID=980011 RepID=UPI004049A5F2